MSDGENIMAAEMINDKNEGGTGGNIEHEVLGLQ